MNRRLLVQLLAIGLAVALSGCASIPANKPTAAATQPGSQTKAP